MKRRHNVALEKDATKLVTLLNTNAEAEELWVWMLDDIENQESSARAYDPTIDLSDTTVAFTAGRWYERSVAELHEQSRGKAHDDTQQFEALLVPNLLLRFMQNRAIGYIRRCQQCGKWMFARRSDKRACSNTCQHKPYMQKPEVREHKNRYARYWYKLNESKEWVNFKGKRPTFDEWCEQKEPSPDRWKAILKGVKL